MGERLHIRTDHKQEKLDIHVRACRFPHQVSDESCMTMTQARGSMFQTLVTLYDVSEKLKTCLHCMIGVISIRQVAEVSNK